MANHDEFDKLIARRRGELREQAEEQQQWQRQAAEAVAKREAYARYAAEQLMAADVEPVAVTRVEGREFLGWYLGSRAVETVCGWLLELQPDDDPDDARIRGYYRGRILGQDGYVTGFGKARAGQGGYVTHGQLAHSWCSERELTDLLVRYLPDREER